MRSTLALAIVALALAGCRTPTSCWSGDDSNSRRDRCAADKAALAAERERRARPRVEPVDHPKVRKGRYERALEPCKQGDVDACMTVGTYATEENIPGAHVDHALAVACGADRSQACVYIGDRARGHDDPRALHHYERACELSNKRGCVAASALAPAKRVELETRACELHDHDACERVGLILLERGDRERARPFLERACRHDRKLACRRVGELAAEGS